MLDKGNYRVHRYSRDGTLRESFGRRGEGPEDLPFLSTGSTLAVARGRLAVFMAGPQRVLWFDLPDLTPAGARLSGFATSVAFDGATLHATMTSDPEGGLPTSAIHRFSRDADPWASTEALCGRAGTMRRCPAGYGA